MGISFFGKKKESFFLVLDVGTEAIKALICQKENNKIIVLGISTQYFERYGIFNGRDFEKDVIKRVILKAIEEAKKERAGMLKKMPVLVSLPANIFKARIVWQSFERKKSKEKISKEEKDLIYRQCFKEAQKEISQRFSQDFGILSDDIQWISQKVLEIKINGYPVLRLQGYEGRNLKLKILATFSLKPYLENIKKIFKDLQLEISKIVHIAENLAIIWQDKKIDGVFLDIGGEVSQVFLVKKGCLEQVNEFSKGGRLFSQRLSEKLGVEEELARNLKERYSNGFLSTGTNERIKEIFLEGKKAWQEDLKIKIQEMDNKYFLFGGGSLLPEIQWALKEEGKELNPVRDYGNNEETQREEISNGVKFIEPKDLKDIEDPTKKVNSPQYIPALLIITRRN